MKINATMANALERIAPALLAVMAPLFLMAASAAAGEAAGGMPNLQALFGGGGSTQQASKNQLDAESLRTLLSKERNVIIEEQGGMLIVDGRVSSRSAQIRLAKILEKYDNILDLTEFIQDEEAILARADYLKQKIEERLNKGYDPERAFAPKQRVDYEIVENEVIIVGQLNNDDDVEQVGRIINTYEKGATADTQARAAGGDGEGSTATNHLTVSKQPLEVDVIFARIDATDSRSMGLGGLITGTVTIPELIYAPPGSGGAAEEMAGTGSGTMSLRKVFNQNTWTAGQGGAAFGAVTLSLNELESTNRVLSRPHLATLNGTPAKFHAGGQIGMRLVGSDSSSVEWKDYGTILTATPTLTTDGRVHMKLTLEVTAPTSLPGLAAEDVGFTRFEHESEAIVSANQGMVLSGIVRDIRGKGGDGVPGLRRIPILGYFFGGRTRSVESEELLIVAIPRFPEVINNHPVVNTATSSRIINGVVQEMMRRDGQKSQFGLDCDPVTGEPILPEVRIDVLPAEVTMESGEIGYSPAMPGHMTPSFEPQPVDLMGDLVVF